MRETSDFDTVLRAMRIFNGFNGPSSDELWWRTDDQYAPVTLLINCNDLFFWGCSDCETLTPANIGELEKAAEDMKALHPKGDYDEAGLLFCCRQRQMRPQGAYYAHIEKCWWPLFNLCGPERDTGLGNPKAIPAA